MDTLEIRKLAMVAHIRNAADQGLFVEVGFEALEAQLSAVPVDDGLGEAAREMFFAGAHHVFAGLCMLLERNDEDEADLDRMEKIGAELDSVYRDFCERYGIPSLDAAKDSTQ